MIYINILWIVFTLIGAGLFGLFPATATMFILIRKKVVLKEDNLKVFSFFWNSFRKEFLKINIFALIFSVVGCILYLNIMFLLLHTDEYLFLVPGTVILSIIYIMTFISFFPVYAFYDLTITKYLKQSFLISATSPIELLITLPIILIIGVLIFWVPGFLLLLGGSTLAFMLTIIMNRIFIKIDKHKTNT